MENKLLTAKESAYAFVLSFILGQLFLVLFAAVGVIVCRIAGMDSTIFYDFVSKDLGYLLSAIVLNFGFLLTFLLFKKGRTDKIASKPKATKILFYLLVAAVAYFALYPVVASFNTLFKIKGTALNISGWGYVYAAFSRVIIPAICEELLFRGLIFTGIANKNKCLAIFLSALMFGIFHMSSEQLLYPILMGLLFGVIMAYEGNIIYCILVHITNNALALSGLGFFANHWAYYLAAGLIFCIFIAGAIVLAIKANKNCQPKKFDKNETITLIASIGIMAILWILYLVMG